MDVEDHLTSIFNGQATPAGKNVDAGPHDEFVPMTKVNMCYICGAVLFNENGDVLMIQEAKKSCRGSWYLPAGRLEQGETIIEGTKREVKEEAGLECDLTTLLCVEMQSTTWVRFTFTGRVTGGKLKTTDEQDGESIQAKFFSMEELQANRKTLRCGDVFKLIEAGRKYWDIPESSRRQNTIPVISPHRKLIHRVIITDRASFSANSLHVLLNTRDHPHIPTAYLCQVKTGSIAISVYAILKDAFSSQLNMSSVRMCGVLGVEHLGGEDKDGMCLTTLVSLDMSDSDDPPVVSSEHYKWSEITNAVLKRMLVEGCKGKCVPLL